ncbi:hypothetical protein PBY51_003345 [Eleginops maclovinus]|uniref:Uncharacterized protein n=1 Tax=Eleginops maclovinus TaxID=56733 RepID=A0AAN7XFI9_ELEMC|nr:hypothetical protein PBY51_003345 [Eleginops maclovinus]
MKTGRASPPKIPTNGEHEAVQCTMTSSQSLTSQQFASAKPAIGICQRSRVVPVSSISARWREEPEILEQHVWEAS